MKYNKYNIYEVKDTGDEDEKASWYGLMVVLSLLLLSHQSHDQVDLKRKCETVPVWHSRRMSVWAVSSLGYESEEDRGEMQNNCAAPKLTAIVHSLRLKKTNLYLLRGEKDRSSIRPSIHLCPGHQMITFPRSSVYSCFWVFITQYCKGSKKAGFMHTF